MSENTKVGRIKDAKFVPGTKYYIVLDVETDAGIVWFPCDYIPFLRGLEFFYGAGVKLPGDKLNVDAIRGKDIEYYLDRDGVLEGFTPVGWDLNEHLKSKAPAKPN